MKYSKIIKDLYFRNIEEECCDASYYDYANKTDVLEGIKISNITHRNRIYYLNNFRLYNYHIRKSDGFKHYFIWV